MPAPTPHRRLKKSLIALHVASGGAWLGAALCMLVIGIVNRGSANGAALSALDLLLDDIDGSIMIATALLAALSGLLLCWWTTWGFFKFFWLIAKQVLTLGALAFSYVGLHGWVSRMVEISLAEGAAALLSPAYVYAAKAQTAGSVVMTAVLATIVAISVLKPWGRRVRRSTSP